MKTPRDFIIAVCFVMGLGLGSPAEADAALRQYYSGWTYYAARGYYYRTYYSKPDEEYLGYQHQYCIYYTAQPRYLYFFDPETRVYWGRFDTHGEPGAEYSVLAEKDRREKLTDIPESAFPPPGDIPPIPGARDGMRMIMPKDLPARPSM